MFDNFGFPLKSIHKQFLPKNTFYEHADFKQKDKDLFVNEIKRITLYAQLTRDSTNIEQYKDEERSYNEVSIVNVKLKILNQTDQIAKIIMESISYPMILMLQKDDKYIFYGSHHRDNQIDKDKTIVERIYKTDLLSINNNFCNKINYINLSKTNFYKLYDDYLQAIIRYNLSKRGIKKELYSEETLNKVKALEQEIEVLKNRMRKETQFNRKMQLNIEIKGLEQNIKQMEENNE